MYQNILLKISNNQRGITLVELLVGMSILSLVLALSYTVFSYAYDSYGRGESHSDVRQNVRLVADFITQELRYATHVRIYAEGEFNDILSNGFDHPFEVFDPDDSQDYFFIYVNNGKMYHKKPGPGLQTPFSSISQNIYLEKLWLSLVGTEHLEYQIANSGADGYSIKSRLKFLNNLAEHGGSTGVAVAYKVRIPPPTGGSGGADCIRILTERDLAEHLGAGPDTLFDDGNVYNATMDACYNQEDNLELEAAGYDNWEPIGSEAEPFRGTYNGNGFTISNLRIEKTNANSGGSDYFGLFGVTSDATLKDIGLTSVDILARRQVGGLVGHAKDGTTIENCFVEGVLSGNGGSQRLGGLVGLNENSTITDSYFSGTIENAGSEAGGLVGSNSSDSTILRSYTTGSIKSSNGNVGGLVGNNGSMDPDDSIIKESYSTMEVEGEDRVGGLVGRNNSYSKIDNSYATGVVTGKKDVGGLVGNNRGGNSVINKSYSIGEVVGSSDTGGLVGRENNSNISDSYWDTETSGQNSSAGGEGKTTAEMLQRETYNDWDFDETWRLTRPVNPITKGSGTQNDPYKIETAEQLNYVRYLLDKHYVLRSNIDLGIPPWNEGEGWLPIGGKNNISYPCLQWQDPDTCPKADTKFTGVFDGNGRTISNLTIERPGEDYVGLFGISETGIFKGIIMDGATVTGNQKTGGLVGYLEQGSITNVSINDMAVTGHHDTGGMVGEVTDSTIIDCHVSGGEVKRRGSNPNRIGGLIGRSKNTVITNSSSRAETVEGNQYIGGLVGYFDAGSIIDCYSTSNIEAARVSGGLVGQATGHGNIIERSFARGDIEASLTTGFNVGGLVGDLGGSGERSIINCYATGIVSGGGNADDQRGVGGLIGNLRGGSITNSYAIGRVTAEGTIESGGLAGKSSGNINNSYYDYQTTGKFSADTSKGIPKRSELMVKQDTFEPEWDFNGIWSIKDDNTTYPCLQWQNGIIGCPPADLNGNGDGLVYYVDGGGNIVSMEFSNKIILDDDGEWVQLIITSGVGEQTHDEFEYYARDGVIIESGVEFISTTSQGYIKITADSGDIVIEEGVKFTTDSTANNETDEIFLETGGNIDIRGVEMEARRYLYFEAGQNIFARNATLATTTNSARNDIKFEVSSLEYIINVDNLFINFTRNNKRAIATPEGSVCGILRDGSDPVENYDNTRVCD